MEISSLLCSALLGGAASGAGAQGRSAPALLRAVSPAPRWLLSAEMSAGPAPSSAPQTPRRAEPGTGQRADTLSFASWFLLCEDTLDFMRRTVGHKCITFDHKGGSCGTHENSSRAPAAKGEPAAFPCAPSGDASCHKPQLMARQGPHVCVWIHGGARAGAARHAGGTASSSPCAPRAPARVPPHFSIVC